MRCPETGRSPRRRARYHDSPASSPHPISLSATRTGGLPLCGCAYIFSGVLAHPDWGATAGGLAVANLPSTRHGILVVATSPPRRRGVPLSTAYSVAETLVQRGAAPRHLPFPRALARDGELMGAHRLGRLDSVLTALVIALVAVSVVALAVLSIL